MATAAKDVRAAREFLRKRGIKGVSPRKFARSASETGMSYRALLDFLAGVAKKHGNSTSAIREGPTGSSERASQ